MLHKNLSILFISLLVNSISYAQVKKKILTENEKIEQLILAIQNLKSAQFNRNGTLYDAETASKHLKMKWIVLKLLKILLIKLRQNHQ